MDLIDRFDQKLWTSGDANTVEGTHQQLHIDNQNQLTKHGVKVDFFLLFQKRKA